MARLNKYLIADDVTLTDVSDDYFINHVLEELKGPRCSVANRFGVSGTDIFDDQEADLSPGTFETLRIVNGVPKWPNELFPGLLPPEAGLDETSVSYQKGCYTGQEVISRMKRAGKVNRSLVKLTLHQPLIPAKSALIVDGKEAGVITSVTRHEGIEIAMGYLKRTFASVEEFQVASPSSGEIIGTAELR